jgi:hypothetical protein
MIFAVKPFGAVLASFVRLSVARSEKFNQYTRVTLVAYLCNGVTCIHEPVQPKMMWRVRSKIIWEAMVFRCPIITCSANPRGFNDASQWLIQSPKYHTWLLHGVTRTQIRHSL